MGVTETTYLSGTTILDLFQAAAGEHRTIEVGAFNVPRRISILVAMFDEQLAFPSAGLDGTHACP